MDVMDGGRRLIVSPRAADRLAAARAWLAEQPADRELLVVASSRQAADELLRGALGASGAAFGWSRATLDRLASDLARTGLAERGLTPATALNGTAVAARASHLLSASASGRLARLAEIAGRPGFPAALARTLGELRMAGLDAERVAALGAESADLAALLGRFLGELAELRFADRADVYRTATDLLARTAPADASPDRPVLLLDLRVGSHLEQRFVAALAGRSGAVLATLPEGDPRSARLLEEALGAAAVPLARTATAGPGAALAALQSGLFGASTTDAPGRDESVELVGSPGTARECVEIARAIQARAEAGIRFDDLAVLVHAPGEYAAHVEEALRRADIPAWFVRGTRRPHPAGRALLALLACAGERLSARRFAEYLSLAQVPSPTEVAQADGFTPARDDLLPAHVAELAEDRAEPGDDATENSPATAEAAGTPSPAPWRWDRLLTDAAVIGGSERWEKRLKGLDEELTYQVEQLEDHEETRAAALERRRADLRALATFALPLVQRLSALPKRATWGEWLEHLDGLVRAAIREPGPLLALLAELAPSGPVGPVGLEEVRIVLAPRLRELPIAPARRRHGAVFVGTPESARGLAFDTVFVPGLAERIFPGKIVDDPLLPDPLRRRIGAGLLETQDDRAANERLALRLAVGAARTRVVLSYPRVDVEQARSRVPSFYLLEARRAVEGRLLGFGEITAETRAARGERLGWPAPGDPDQAIDEAEYDLALLAPLIGDDDERTAGTARYLLGTNVHLARALRARGRRWLRAWTPADGLVEPTGPALDAVARHRIDARSFSPTALQNFAACPYRFFLQALVRLAPAEEAVAIETLDPLTRGAIFHDAQFEILSELRDRGWLPVRSAPIDAVLDVADACLDRVAERERDRLAPAIGRVWEDAVAALRADLREWLHRAAKDETGWTPHRFELSFGVVDRDRRYADPASTADPVPLDVGLRLRGSIDLVERSEDGRLRVTDHKTGRVRADDGVVIGKGEVLQPILYALAAKELLDAPVEAGRLYYCTSAGAFTERVVPLDATARGAAVTVADVVGRALAGGFLPAAPRDGACRFCDYRPVCGPYEEIRVKRKQRDRLADLARLRELE